MAKKSSTRVAHDLAKVWQEHRGISIVPSFGALEPPSTWDRIKSFFKEFRKGFFLSSLMEGRPKKEVKEETLGNIAEDSSVIYTKFSGRDDFTPQFAADKLKELGWSVEEIRKLGRAYEGIK